MPMVTTSLGYNFACGTFFTPFNWSSTGQKIWVIISSVVMGLLNFGVVTKSLMHFHDYLNLHHWLINNPCCNLYQNENISVNITARLVLLSTNHYRAALPKVGQAAHSRTSASWREHHRSCSRQSPHWKLPAAMLAPVPVWPY